MDEEQILNDNQPDSVPEGAANKTDDLLRAVEALLFVYGSPISIERLVKILEKSGAEVEAALEKLSSLYTETGRGLLLIRNQNEVELGTVPEAAPFIEKLVKEDFRQDLTTASLETLALVVYRGPISRPEIDSIRGVNSSFMLRSLLVRGLVTREPDPKRANIYLYRPSFDFLRLLGINDVKDLPDFEDLSKKIVEFESKNVENEEQTEDNEKSGEVNAP